MSERPDNISWLLVGEMNRLTYCKDPCAVCAGHPSVMQVKRTWSAITAQEAEDELLAWYREAYGATGWVTKPHVEKYDPQKGYTLSADDYKRAGAGYSWNHDVDRIDRNGPYGNRNGPYGR
jgi:hypothetical protein